jgi:hypothetical protein
VEYVLYNPVVHRRSKYLLLERHGGVVTRGSSLDGKRWERDAGRPLNPPRRLKVGVVAECNSPFAFATYFEDFRLTPLGGKTR